jgi:serine/threonine protein kinase
MLKTIKYNHESYQLQELLGEGGSGSTYRAIRLSDKSLVAIKILSLRHLNDWKQLELFEREAKVLAQLDHPQIPQYLDYFHIDTPDNRAFYIVQQLAPGKPLTNWVQMGWRGTEVDVRNIARQLLEILQYLHQQSPPLIHRDIKPHNIVRNDDGQVFLVDFGAVQNVYNNTLLKGSTVAGTYGYMAPEQFRGMALSVSDLYGLGATILYLLTHRSPAELPQERLKLSFQGHVNISDNFAEWLETMLEPDTVDRFSSAATALIALQKKHRFRRARNNKIGLSWKGAVAAVILLTLPFINQYRYAFLGMVGLRPTDLCNKIMFNDNNDNGVAFLDDYLNHGGSVNGNSEITSEITFDDTHKRGVGDSLLHCALMNRNNEIAKYLLKLGANPQVLNGNQSSLWHVLAGNKGSRPRFKGDFYDEKKYRRDIQPIIQQLLESKVDFNKPNNIGDTPLHAASKYNNPVLINILLSHNAKNNSRNAQGQTPLMAAVNNKDNDSDTIKLFLAKGVEVNIPDNDGKTPIAMEIEYANSCVENLKTTSYLDKCKDSLKIINMLLDRGAKPNIADQKLIDDLPRKLHDNAE